MKVSETAPRECHKMGRSVAETIVFRAEVSLRDLPE